MDFLERIYFENTVRNYLAIGLTILIAIFLKRYLSRFIASIAHTFVKRTWSTVDKKSFVDLVVDPLEWFLFVLIVVFSLDKLNFPEAFRFSIYHKDIQVVLEKLGNAAMVISFIRLILSSVDFVAMLFERRAKTTTDKADDQLVIFFRDFFKVILSVVGVLLLLKYCFGQNIGNLLTGLSIVGAAIALAAKESLENLIASFIIFFDKPFYTGDIVKVQNVTGTIERIGLRSTRIRTTEKTLVTVPNKQMVDSLVDNYSMRTQRRAEIRTELEPKTNAITIEKIIEEFKQILQADTENILSGSVFLKEINKSGLTIVIEYFTFPITMAEYDTIKEKVNLSVKKILEKNDVEMAGSTTSISVVNESKGNEA